MTGLKEDKNGVGFTDEMKRMVINDKQEKVWSITKQKLYSIKC